MTAQRETEVQDGEGLGDGLGIFAEKVCGVRQGLKEDGEFSFPGLLYV
jgi:hypothetical protein